MSDDPRHDRLLDIVQAVAQATYPRGIPAKAYHNELHQAWWNRVYKAAGIDVFLPDSPPDRLKELMTIWQHCIEKQAERHAAWASKIEEWYPEREEIEVQV